MKNIAALISLLGFSLCALAQAPKEKTLLWEVSGKGIAQPSYIYGTIHLMCPQDLQVPDVVKEKFNSTEHLFLEIDMDDPAMMQEMMMGMAMKDNTTIAGLLGDEAYEKLNKTFSGKVGISLDMLKRTKPMLLMALVYPSMLGCQPDSWEKTFQTLAEGKNMKVSGLEKVADQIKVFEKIPYKIQADMLMDMMNNLDSSKASFASLIEVYKSKDINKMQEMTMDDKNFAEYESILLNDRNNNWVPVIINQAKQKPTFFAVGAAHLGGLNGVINLLRQQGISVKPILY
ncbi:MAG TPA: TraB/GumN family protein [Segetibacter sp.]|jgi:hypothetical protein